MNFKLNPYRSERPAEGRMFFGRGDIVAWVQEQVIKGRPVIVVHGPERIGKTSLLRHLAGKLPPDCVPVWIGLAVRAEDGSSSLWAVADAVARALAMPRPPQADFAGEAAEDAFIAFLNRARGVLGEGRLVLLLDDFEQWADDVLVRALVAAIHAEHWLSILATATDFEALSHRWPELFADTVHRDLGPLLTHEAEDLVRRPVEDVLRYDPWAVTRVLELTSNHPRFIQFLCRTLVNRCIGSEDVTPSDVEAALDDLLNTPQPTFEQWWAVASPRERVILAALAALRGKQGVATQYDVHQFLSKLGARVELPEVEDVLAGLERRGILVRMGANSFRFAVELCRLWVAHQHPVEAVLREGPWRVRRRPARRPPPVKGKEHPQPESSRDLGWIGLVVLLGTGLLFLLAHRFTPSVSPPAGLKTPAGGDPSRTVVPTGLRAPVLATPTPIPTPAIAYASRQNTGEPLQIYLMNEDGSFPVRLTLTEADEFDPVWSPDGRRIAFVSLRDGNQEIYVMNADGSDQTNITRHENKDWTPAWSPDGSQLAFSSFRDENWEIYVMDADGSNVVRLTDNPASDVSPSWSPDGQRIAFASRRDGGDWDIFVMDRTGKHVTQLTHDPADDFGPIWSPDGTTIAFESDRDGYVDIFLMAADGSNQINLTRDPYADYHGPTWSSDGKRIMFYSNRDGDWDIYVMNRDGSGLVNITDDDSDEQAPSWRP
ncbi:MAG: PD40 domain-containing protein [Anaerolineae bacterium]|nr:PD40 domain-containing protein [Anaerolineae bacterium]